MAVFPSIVNLSVFVFIQDEVQHDHFPTIPPIDGSIFGSIPVEGNK